MALVISTSFTSSSPRRSFQRGDVVHDLGKDRTGRRFSVAREGEVIEPPEWFGHRGEPVVVVEPARVHEVEQSPPALERTRSISTSRFQADSERSTWQ